MSSESKTVGFVYGLCTVVIKNGGKIETFHLCLQKVDGFMEYMLSDKN